MEYEADTGLLAFMEQVGFKYSLTRADGFPVVEMTIDAPFDSLKISTRALPAASWPPSVLLMF
jgi:hypothetical protein